MGQTQTAERKLCSEEEMRLRCAYDPLLVRRLAAHVIELENAARIFSFAQLFSFGGLLRFLARHFGRPAGGSDTFAFEARVMTSRRFPALALKIARPTGQPAYVILLPHPSSALPVHISLRDTVSGRQQDDAMHFRMDGDRQARLGGIIAWAPGRRQEIMVSREFAEASTEMVRERLGDDAAKAWGVCLADLDAMLVAVWQETEAPRPETRADDDRDAQLLLAMEPVVCAPEQRMWRVAGERYDMTPSETPQDVEQAEQQDAELAEAIAAETPSLRPESFLPEAEALAAEPGPAEEAAESAEQAAEPAEEAAESAEEAAESAEQAAESAEEAAESAEEADEPAEEAATNAAAQAAPAAPAAPAAQAAPAAPAALAALAAAAARAEDPAAVAARTDRIAAWLSNRRKVARDLNLFDDANRGRRISWLEFLMVYGSLAFVEDLPEWLAGRGIPVRYDAEGLPQYPPQITETIVANHVRMFNHLRERLAGPRFTITDVAASDAYPEFASEIIASARGMPLAALIQQTARAESLQDRLSARLSMILESVPREEWVVVARQMTMLTMERFPLLLATMIDALPIFVLGELVGEREAGTPVSIAAPETMAIRSLAHLPIGPDAFYRARRNGSLLDHLRNAEYHTASRHDSAIAVLRLEWSPLLGAFAILHEPERRSRSVVDGVRYLVVFELLKRSVNGSSKKTILRDTAEMRDTVKRELAELFAKIKDIEDPTLRQAASERTKPMVDRAKEKLRAIDILESKLIE